MCHWKTPGSCYTGPKLREACTPDAKLEKRFSRVIYSNRQRNVCHVLLPTPKVQVSQNPLTISTGLCIGNPQNSMRQEG